MRGVYIRKSNPDNRGGSRGGVGSLYSEYGSGMDYALEIGNGQNADCEMLALCSLVDEVRELLELSNSPLAKLVLKEWKATTKKLETELEKP